MQLATVPHKLAAVPLETGLSEIRALFWSFPWRWPMPVPETSAQTHTSHFIMIYY